MTDKPNVTAFNQSEQEAADEMVRLGYATRTRVGPYWQLTLTPAGIAFRDAVLRGEVVFDKEGE